MITSIVIGILIAWLLIKTIDIWLPLVFWLFIACVFGLAMLALALALP